MAASVVGLVTAVALTSGGSTPRGRGGAPSPSEGLVDVVFTLLSLVVALGFVALVVAVVAIGSARGDERLRRRRATWRPLLVLLAMMALSVLVVRFLARGSAYRLPLEAPPGGAAETSPTGQTPPGYEPRFLLWPVLVVAALALLAGVSWWLARRGRRRALGEGRAGTEEALAEVLAGTLDDLRAERDPRRAVIAAYARMERALAASGLPRRRSEAPEEYLTRVLAAAPLSRDTAGRLTALFAWARFSGHDVRPEMRDEAIETLERVQAELAAAEAAHAVGAAA